MTSRSFLRTPSEAAGPGDEATIQDLVDTLEANRSRCVGMERRTLRCRRIEVNYEDRRFRARHATFTGWTAQIIQHEVDHCNGIII